MWHMGNGAHGQWGTWVDGTLVNTADTDGGPWGMGHIGNKVGNRAHGQYGNFLNTAWIFTKILLDIDIDGFSSNIV